MGNKATRQTSSKRALLASVLSLVICAAMLVGTTFAWFTDSVTSKKNTIVAGNLDVELEYATVDDTGVLSGWKSVDGATDLFADGLWEPGYAQVVYLRVSNLGTLALKYQFSLNITSETPGTNVDGEQFLLSDYLQYGVVNGRDTAFATRAEAIAAVQNPAPLDTYTKAGNLAAGGDPQYVALVVYMPETVGNEANYRGSDIPTIALGLNLTATQDTVESDSFDNTYDAGASQELTSGVGISGIAGLENQVFPSLQDAYAAGNEILATLGLGQESASDAQFDAIFTNGGAITWTIYGEQTLADNEKILTFGRASNRYSSTRSIREINVVGGNGSAKLSMQNVGLPYAWWNDAEDALAVHFKDLQITAMGSGQITCSRAYGSPLTVTFDHCDIAGHIYHYFNAEGTISITNCNFTDNGTNSYAFFVQGSETEPLTVTFSGNTVTGFTRWINIQQKTAVVTIQNNTFVSSNSEPDRGVLQLTDAASCLVDGNIIDVNGGNAFWFHSAASNEAVQYTITNNQIRAPYLINDDTTFGIASHITSSGNTVEVQYPGYCMEKDASVATESNVTLN